MKNLYPNNIWTVILIQVVPVSKAMEENRTAAVRTMVGGANEMPVMTLRP